MLECLRAKKSAEGKRNLEVFFTVLVEYIEGLCCEPSMDIYLADQLTSILCNLASTMPHKTKNVINDVLIKQSHTARSQQRLQCLSMSQLVMLWLCGVLIPIADDRCRVSTATITLLSKYLSQCKVTSSCEAFRGLFLLSVVHELVHESNKYVPEVPLFLSHVFSRVCKSLASSCSKETEHNEVQTWKVAPISLSKLLPGKLEESHLSWLSVLHMALRVLSKFALLYQKLASYPSMFDLITGHLVSLSSVSLPVAIQEQLTQVTMQLKTVHMSLTSLQFQHQKPTPLRLYTPQFKESFIDTNTSTRLRVKHKKELRGAIRELRQDAAFLSRQKLRDQLESDLERKRRVKALQQMLSTERAEMKQHKKKEKFHSGKRL
jgi:nucleolar protein 14